MLRFFKLRYDRVKFDIGFKKKKGEQWYFIDSVARLDHTFVSFAADAICVYELARFTISDGIEPMLFVSNSVEILISAHRESSGRLLPPSLRLCVSFDFWVLPHKYVIMQKDWYNAKDCFGNHWRQQGTDQQHSSEVRIIKLEHRSRMECRENISLIYICCTVLAVYFASITHDRHKPKST